MVICRCCNGNCDNGELINGICPECIEEEKQRKIRAKTVNKILNSQSVQMKMHLDIIKSKI